MKNRRLLAAVIPVILVNIIAISGQYAFMRADWHWPTISAAGAAVAIESIAVYLAYMYHESLMDEDAAYGLRLGSIVMGLLAGLMNYSHYSPGWQPGSKGIVLGILSASSPWLWNVYTKRASRPALKSKGLIEDRAVKLGSLRWVLWPSRAFPVFRHAVWAGISKPAEAIAHYQVIQAGRAAPEGAPEGAPWRAEGATLASARTKADAVRFALTELGATLAASEVAAWLRERNWDVSPNHVRKVRSALARVDGNGKGAHVLALPVASMNGVKTADQDEYQ